MILPDPAQIIFAEYFAVDHHLLVTKGHTFDRLIPNSRLLIPLFATWHQFRATRGLGQHMSLTTAKHGRGCTRCSPVVSGAAPAMVQCVGALTSGNSQ